jgi:thiol-disulfide isomerase/thioredoxin
MFKKLTITVLCISLMFASGCTEKPDGTGTEGVDIDFTRMSATLVSAQIDNMFADIPSYIGQTMKIQGEYSPFFWSAMGTTVHFMLIDCPSGCMKQIEFKLHGGRIYPDEYPDIGDMIEITGVFGTYRVEGFDTDIPYLSAEDLIIIQSGLYSEGAGSPNDTEEPAPDYFLLPHDFTATDLYGNTVTHETLGEKRAFLVHLWATWCGPCVRGMPDLAGISQIYADDVGFIGLVLDFDSNAEGAVDIITASGVPDSFIMIDAYEPSVAALFEIVRTGFVPSTALITKDNHNPEPLTQRNYAELLDEILGG